MEPAPQLDEGQVDPDLVQFEVEPFEHVGGGDVDVGHRLALEHDPAGLVLADEVAELLAEHAGVGEEQRRLPPEDDDVRRLLGVRCPVAHAVPARPLETAEQLAVRPPAALEEQHDREHDRGDDALEHAEEDDAAGGDQREHERRSCGRASSDGALSRSASESAAAMTTAASVVCGRSASSDGKASSSSATSPAPTRPVSWLLAPDCSATAVREPLVETAKPWKKPAAMFAVADADHLLVRVDLVAAAGGEARRRWRWCR